MKIKDTLSGELKDFEPEDPVRMYYCGLTVSDSPHLGHARGWVHVDVLRRFLEYQGHEVRHVENITDVNQKIFNQLNNEGVDASSEQELADSYTEEVFEVMSDLNLRRATAYPRVSNHVEEIIEYVESLIESGYAYESNSSVYFDVRNFDEYGKLSNQDPDDMVSDVNSEEISDKKSDADFALWKHADPEDDKGQTWESPWGFGRPGWHIECSVMSSTHLDLPLDIHIGGQDLVFPHHENEIAQSEASSGERFANNWMHIRLLNSDEDSEKMSSSRDNFRTAKSLINEYGSNAVRWFLLSSNYDKPQLYTEDKVGTAQDNWNQVKKSYAMLKESFETSSSNTTVTHDEFRKRFNHHISSIESTLSNNLNTRETLSYVKHVASLAENYISEKEMYDQMLVHEFIDFYQDVVSGVLGFRIESESAGDDPVQDIAKYRDRLRDSTEYEKADAIRDALEHAGYNVEDTDDRTIVIKEE